MRAPVPTFWRREPPESCVRARPCSCPPAWPHTAPHRPVPPARGVVALLRRAGHAHADRRPDLAVAAVKLHLRALDPGADPLGELGGAVDVGLGQGNREFLAAEAGWLVHLARLV